MGFNSGFKGLITPNCHACTLVGHIAFPLLALHTLVLYFASQFRSSTVLSALTNHQLRRTGRVLQHCSGRDANWCTSIRITKKLSRYRRPKFESRPATLPEPHTEPLPPPPPPFYLYCLFTCPLTCTVMQHVLQGVPCATSCCDDYTDRPTSVPVSYLSNRLNRGRAQPVRMFQ